MAKAYVSFDEVKMRVSMEQVLVHYGLLDARTKHKGDELTLHCVFHDNDTTPSLKINTAKNIFNCFGCHQGGDVIGFVVLKEGIETGHEDADRREAALLLQEWFNLSTRQSGKTRRRSRPPARGTSRAEAPAVSAETDVEETLPRTHAEARQSKPARDTENISVVNPPLQFAFRNLDPTHPYLTARGLTEETIATFGLGFHAGRGIMHGRIVIPIHNETGELIAYAGRWPAEEGWPEGEDKYKLPSGFHKSLVLFNLHRAREHASEGLIVVEGCFDTMDYWQRGRKNIVAVMGSFLSPKQEQLIVKTVGPRGRVLLAFDPDDAGRKGMQDAAARLVSQVFVRTVTLGQSQTS
jgi:DNA primase